MRPRALLLWWIGVGAVIWNGFYDTLITRGVKEYLMREALARLGDGPPASLPAIMAQTSHDAAITSSIWAAGVTAAGWATVWLARRKPV